jgi:hypothetical protein
MPRPVQNLLEVLAFVAVVSLIWIAVPVGTA